MRILETPKNHSYWNNAPYSGAPNKDSLLLNLAFELVKQWDSGWDYFFDNEDEMGSYWPFQEEEKIFNELQNIGYELYIGPRGKGVIDIKNNLLYHIHQTPLKPISGIRSAGF